MLVQKYKLKVTSKWVVLTSIWRAIVNLRVLHRQRLYCCLFPTNYEFERETLVHLWIATGYLLEPKEKFAEKRFDRLLAENCISKPKLDVVNRVEKYKVNVGKISTPSKRLKSKDYYTIIEDGNTKVDGSMTSHVSLVSKRVNKKVFQTLEGLSELRSVIFLSDYGSSLKQIPSSFFSKALPCIKALDLSGSHISELPSSIGNMTQLCFLDLSFTLIERIPESVSRLEELQSLRLKGCKHLHKLPQGTKDLVKLHHLDFDVLGQLTCMPKGLGSLTKLRTLSAFIVSEEDGCSIKELKDMNDLRGSLCISGLECVVGEAFEAAMQEKTGLTRLHLKWNGSKCYDISEKRTAFSTLHFLRPHDQTLKELMISYYPGPVLSVWIENARILHKLESITFHKCENETFLLELQYLPSLKHLNIFDMNGVTIIDSIIHRHDVKRFPELETVTIIGMRNLQLWSGAKHGDFPRLRELRIKHCPKLNGLPFLPYLDSLKYLEISHCKSFKLLPKGKLSTSLETLIIDNCPSLKKKCSKERGWIKILCNNEDWAKIKHVPNIWIDMKDVHSARQDTGKDSLSDDEEYNSDDSDQVMSPILKREPSLGEMIR